MPFLFFGSVADQDIDYTQIPMSALIGDVNDMDLEGGAGQIASSIEQDMEKLSTRYVLQFSSPIASIHVH